ncbi:MAG: hypothetical protein ABFS37_16345, partial [Acidobacteriota bacterium]
MLTSEQALALLHSNNLQWLEPWMAPSDDMDNARGQPPPRLVGQRRRRRYELALDPEVALPSVDRALLGVLAIPSRP